MGSNVKGLSWLLCCGREFCSRIADDLRDDGFATCSGIAGNVGLAGGDDAVCTGCSAGIFLFNFKADDLTDVDFQACLGIGDNVVVGCAGGDVCIDGVGCVFL